MGVVVPFFTHASAVERLRGVVDELRGSRYDVVLFNVESPLHRDEHFANLLRRDRADGLLIVSLPPPPAALARLAAEGVPIVLVDARGEGVPTVVTDDVAGGREATSHLVALGHERIAFIGDSPNNPFGFTSSACREQGYRRTLADAGIPFDHRFVRHGAHERAVGRRLAEQLLALADRPTAIFAASDVLATGVLEAARAADVDVPGDLSVVGFDDIRFARYMEPPLTTVSQPMRAIGEGTVRLLLAILSDGTVTPDSVTLPHTLVTRGSTAAPPARR